MVLSVSVCVRIREKNFGCVLLDLKTRVIGSNGDEAFENLHWVRTTMHPQMRDCTSVEQKKPDILFFVMYDVGHIHANDIH